MQLDLEELMSSLEGSRVNRSALPGSAAARKITVTSGLKCLALSKLPGPLGSLLRTLVGSPLWHSGAVHLKWQVKPVNVSQTTISMRRYTHERMICYSHMSVTILKRWAMPSSRLLFQLVPSMPRTAETGSGLLPTMTAHAAIGSRNTKFAQGGTPLNHSSILWSTPTVNGNHNRKGMSKNSGDGLATAVRMWPTPCAMEPEKDLGKFLKKRSTPRSERGGGVNPNLATAVKLWPTPASRDYRSPNKKSYSERGGGKKGEQLPNAVGGSLNPNWVEALMGYPPGWTEV